MSRLKIDPSKKQEPSLEYKGESDIVINREKSKNNLSHILDQYGINSIVHKWI